VNRGTQHLGILLARLQQSRVAGLLRWWRSRPQHHDRTFLRRKSRQYSRLRLIGIRETDSKAPAQGVGVRSKYRSSNVVISSTKSVVVRYSGRSVAPS
jgi:hypothetical protein